MSNDTGKDKFRFPVLPEKITITSDGNNESVTVSGLGEVTIIQDPTAKTFEWSCHFPAVHHQGSISKPMTPQEYVDKIEAWKATKKPVKFTVTDPKISLYCSIESWNYYEKGGDPGTFYYTIKLKQYVEPIVRKLDVTPIKKAVATGTSGGGGGSGYPKSGKVKTSGSRLKMYQKKSSSSKVLKKIKNGKSVTVNSADGSWVNITYSSKTGYAKSKYIKT